MAQTITPRGVLTREPERRPIGRLVGAGAMVVIVLLAVIAAASIIRTDGVSGMTLRSLIAVYLPSSDVKPLIIAVPTESEYEFERVFDIERALAAGRTQIEVEPISPSGGPTVTSSAQIQSSEDEPLQVDIMGMHDGLSRKAMR